MRAVALIFWPILLCSLSGEAPAQSGGLFGPRDLGNPIRPGVSQFDDGLQLAPSGAFVGAGRPKGGNLFARPWQPASAAPVYVPFPYATLPNGQVVVIPPGEIVPGAVAAPAAALLQPAVAAETIGQPEAPPPPQSPAGYVPMGQPAPVPSFAVPPGPAGGAPPNNLPPQPVAPSVLHATGVESGSNPPVVSYRAVSTISSVSLGEPGPFVDPASLVNPGLSNGYLPLLSERLTRIARDHGMQVPSPIRVWVVDGTAILRGVVGSPHDRSLIANMARLEPGIERISNQLDVASEGMSPAK
jgi:hypothetical protein